MANTTETNNDSTKWVRIVSDDGYTFIVDRKVALASPYFADALTSDFREAEENTCLLRERGAVTEKVVEYLAYKAQWAGHKGPIPDFTSRLPPEMALELMVVGDYLQT